LGIDTQNYFSIIKLVEYEKTVLNKEVRAMRYQRLKGKITEVFNTQKAFAEAMGWKQPTLNQRLNGGTEWKASEIAKACDLLHIPLADAYLYFFT